MLSDRGRFALALGAGVYVAAWAFGSQALYPVALGLVVAVAAAALWVRALARPVRLHRRVGGAHVAGDDVAVVLEADVAGRLVPAAVEATESIGGHTELPVRLTRAGGRLAGRYVLAAVARGRYEFRPARIPLEDPFGLGRREVELATGDVLLVYPRLVELAALFSEIGRRPGEGRRLPVRRPSGFDLHGVREYQQGESLRRVHWPTTARRGRLMVKELEDSPRDEVLVLLDADATHVLGEPPDTSFELAVSAAGSVVRAYAARNRRTGLVVSGATVRHQSVDSLGAGWSSALELLAAVKPDGQTPIATMLADGTGAAATVAELCLVTAAMPARLADRLLQRAAARRGTSLVYVDAASFASRGGPPRVDVRAQLGRLDRAGVPVCVLRRGDDLTARLGPALAHEREAAGG